MIEANVGLMSFLKILSAEIFFGHVYYMCIIQDRYRWKIPVLCNIY